MIAPEEQAILMKVETSSSPSTFSSTEHLVDTTPPPPSYAVRYQLLDGVGADTERSSKKKQPKIEMVSRGYQGGVALTLEVKYHMAIEGSSFLLVRTHFPDLYNKVGDLRDSFITCLGLRLCV